ncbi:choline dehydrogenase [Ranunculus cassubicifolius]
MELQRTIHLVFTVSFFLLSKSQEFTLPHMTSTLSEISGKSFDYIVVGGGATGCPLVATLSQKYSVLGGANMGAKIFGSHGAPKISGPALDPMVIESENYSLSWIQTNDLTSIAQSFVSQEGVANMRGRVLGGSTAINSGFYSRASEAFIQTLGWDEELVGEAYEWVESKIVFRPNELSVWQTIVKDSLVEAGDLGFNGFSLEHIADGVEVYEAYLNQPEDSQSSGDVILSAGALGSPQILMLSGVGPQEHLKHFNISPVIDATKVGKDIKDNPSVSIQLDSAENRKPDLLHVVGLTQDFQTIVESVIRYINHNETAWGIAAKMTFPVSKGMLELYNTDPRQNPIVRFNYLVEKRDLDQCVKMGSLLEKITQSSSMKEYLGIPQNEDRKLSTDEELAEFCKTNVKTFNHNHGGCGIGSVVDKDFRVYGVQGLRVIDGSTLPDSPGTNPMATLLMLGRYQGIKILEERGDGSVSYLLENL